MNEGEGDYDNFKQSVFLGLCEALPSLYHTSSQVYALLPMGHGKQRIAGAMPLPYPWSTPDIAPTLETRIREGILSNIFPPPLCFHIGAEIP